MMLLKRHGNLAPLKVAERMGELAADGHGMGVAAWVAVAQHMGAILKADSIYYASYSQPMPSPSRSRCLPYPRSPTRTGAAPEALAAEQFGYARWRPAPMSDWVRTAGAGPAGARWQ